MMARLSRHGEMARLSRHGEVRDAPEPRTTMPPAPVPRWLLLALAAAFVVLLLLDLTGLRYGYLDFEKGFGGWAVTALFAALATLLLALALRPLLVRRPDHYEAVEDDL